MALINRGNSIGKKQDQTYVLLTDIMTILMLVFLFISVLFLRILPDKDILAKTSKQNELLTLQLAQVVKQANHYKELATKLAQENDVALKHINELNQQIADETAQKQQALDQIASLTQQTQALTAKLDDETSAKVTALAQLSQLSSQLSDEEKQKTANQATINNLTSQITSLTQINQELLKLKNTISTQFGDYKAKTNQTFSQFRKIQEVRDEIYDKLETTFASDFSKYNISLGKDLTIKFNDPNQLFTSGSDQIRPAFADVLGQIFPKYFNILLSPQFRPYIKAVRIEGHTDPTPANSIDKDSYIGNLILSSNRATSVLRFLRDSRYYRNLDKQDKDYLTFWTGANGFSYSHTLDSDHQLTFYSKQQPNNEFSRRVEIHIITADDALVKQLTDQIEQTTTPSSDTTPNSNSSTPSSKP